MLKALVAYSYLLFGGASVAKATAQIYIRNPSSSPIPSSDITLTPETAKLVLANRIGLSDLYRISTNDEDVIEQIDQYGGPRQQPFEVQHGRQRILVVLEDDKLSTSAFAGYNAISVSDSPSSEATEQLLEEFRTVSKSYRGDSVEYHIPSSLATLAGHSGNKLDTHHGRIIAYLQGSNTQYNEEEALVSSTLQELSTMTDAIITIIRIPSKSDIKYSQTNSWGPKLERRAEALLSSSPKEAKATAQSKASTDYSAFAKNKPIPLRYPSIDSCMKTTHNCTGHGECLLLSTETKNDKKVDSFGCVCNKPSTRKNKDGSKKTTYYGGSACQKVDVSSPFWLLAGTTVFLITILSFGLGMLYSMGSEELPSVIGAGVTGPRAK